MKLVQLNDEATVAEELTDEQTEEVGLRNEDVEEMNESEDIKGGYIAMPAQDLIRGNSDTDNARENDESPAVRDDNALDSCSNDSNNAIPVVDANDEAEQSLAK